MPLKRPLALAQETQGGTNCLKPSSGWWEVGWDKLSEIIFWVVEGGGQGGTNCLKSSSGWWEKGEIIYVLENG